MRGGGRARRQWGEIPAAIVVRKPGSNLTSEELIEFLKARLGKFKLPRIIAFSDEPLPKTGTGRSANWCCGNSFGRVRRKGCKASPHCTRPPWYSVYRGTS